MVSQHSAHLDLHSCASCGSYNPLRFSSCSGCGEQLIAKVTVPLASSAHAKTAVKHAPPGNPPLSTVSMWPLWTTSDEQRLGCALADLAGFVAGRSLIAADRKSGVAVDESAHKVCFFEIVKDTKRGSGNKDVIQRRVVGYESIAEVQTVDGIFRRPLTKGIGTTDETVALLVRLAENGSAFEALINLVTKPHSPGSGNHREAQMRAREWQTYLIGLMHLPGLLAFSAGAANG